MDKQTYAQLDRIEEKQKVILYGIQTMMSQDANGIVIEWYDTLVLPEKAILHHLAEDKKLKEFIEEIRNEEETEEETEEEETQSSRKGETYTQD